MAIEQNISPTGTTTDHPRDVRRILESLPIESQPLVPKESLHTKHLLDVIAKENEDELAKHENSIFRGILTAMTWIGGITVAGALIFTLLAIVK